MPGPSSALSTRRAKIVEQHDGRDQSLLLASLDRAIVDFLDQEAFGKYLAPQSVGIECNLGTVIEPGQWHAVLDAIGNAPGQEGRTARLGERASRRQGGVGVVLCGIGQNPVAQGGVNGQQVAVGAVVLNFEKDVVSALGLCLPSPRLDLEGQSIVGTFTRR